MAMVGNMCAKKLLKTCQYLHTRALVAQYHEVYGKAKHEQCIKYDMDSKSSFMSMNWTCKLLNRCAMQNAGFHYQVNRYYSSDPAKGKAPSAGGLADEILQSKVSSQLKEKDQSVDQKNSSKSDSGNGKKKESWFSGKHAWKLGMLSLLGMGVVMSGNLLYLWGRPMIDPEDGTEIPDEFSTLPPWQAYIKRALKEAKFFKKMIQEPSSKKLLPEPLKPPYYQPRYTLVLEMTGVLVHPDWTLNTGWRFKKRPGVNTFLQQVANPLFEVVIYTHEGGMTAFPIIDQLDPNGCIQYRLFRDATRYMDGHHVKDLSCLNRDLSKIIMIDWDPNASKLHLRNAVHMDKWKGDDDDTVLLDLANFLQTIAASQVDDVRIVLDYYNQFDNPLEAFKENQRKLMEEQENQNKPAEQQSLASGWSRGLVGRKR